MCRSSPTSRPSRCCAGATRDSTSESSSTSQARRSRSGAMCSPAESSRRWWSATPSCASCLVPWVTQTLRWRSHLARSWGAILSIRTTRDRSSIGAGVCLRSCYPATTSASGIGVWNRAAIVAGGQNRSLSALARSPFATIRGRVSECSDFPLTRRLLLMSTVIESIERAQLRRVPDFAPGDRVKVHFQVIEGTRRRIQVFEGVVIKRQGHGARETFTVRKQSFGVGVERSFPVHSPKIERIELAARGDVRRAKLYYLRDRVGKRARVRERRYTGPEEAVEPGLLVEPEPIDAEEQAVGTEADAATDGSQVDANVAEAPAAAPGDADAGAPAGDDAQA